MATSENFHFQFNGHYDHGNVQVQRSFNREEVFLDELAVEISEFLTQVYGYTVELKVA